MLNINVQIKSKNREAYAAITHGVDEGGDDWSQGACLDVGAKGE